MSWGKKDERLSKMLYENGLFLDKRSRVVYDPEMNPHVKLSGQDVVEQRNRLWAKWKERCANCGVFLQLTWEMDHVRGGLVGRCDCLHNLQPLCVVCHRAKHVQVQLKSVPMEVEQQ